MTAIFHAQFLSSFRRLVIPRSEPGFADFFPSWFPPLTPSTSAVKAAPPRGWVWGGGVYPHERKSRMTLRRAQNNAPAPRPFEGVINFITPRRSAAPSRADEGAAGPAPAEVGQRFRRATATTRRHLDRFGGVIIFTPPAPRPFPLQRTDPRPEFFSAALADPQGHEGTGEAQHQDAGSGDSD